MKLEIGMYVRTIKGKIWIINSQQAISGHGKDIINASNNIIDLIEVGDILEIKDIFGNISKVEVDENFELLTGKIISIITHEQIECVQYKVD